MQLIPIDNDFIIICRQRRKNKLMVQTGTKSIYDWV